MENYKKNIRNFVVLMGYLDLIIEMDYYISYKEAYSNILSEIKQIAKEYYYQKNMDFITKDKIKEIRDKIDNLREKILFSCEINDEKLLADEVLIWYDIVFCSNR